MSLRTYVHLLSDQKRQPDLLAALFCVAVFCGGLLLLALFFWIFDNPENLSLWEIINEPRPVQLREALEVPARLHSSVQLGIYSSPAASPAHASPRTSSAHAGLDAAAVPPRAE